MSRRMSLLEQARFRGAQVAAREHSSLGTDLSEPVDIFGILKQREIDVMFQPLGSLYGAYLSAEGTEGVLINVKHPPSLQRFTAAHEYAHQRMRHGPTCDGEDQILPGKWRHSEQEIEAQAFAAHFLMPPKLVNRILHHLEGSYQPGQLSPRQVYQLSLRLGVSYAAVVTHLIGVKKIDQATANLLQRTTPKVIKTEIGQGTGPQDSWADVWMCDERDHGKLFSIYINDELHFYLPEIASLNQIWRVTGREARGTQEQHSFLNEGEENAGIQVIRMAREIDTRETSLRNQPLRSIHHAIIRATAPGQTVLRLESGEANHFSLPSSAAIEVALHIHQRPRQGLNTW